MPDDDELIPGGDPVGDAAAKVVPPAPSTSLSADDVRNSPEYRTLAKENRKLARDKGTADKLAIEAREEAETARLAAEATQLAALEAELGELAGDEGIALWNELSELSASDPRAAARRLGEIIAARAKNPDDKVDPPTDDKLVPAGGTVPASTPPPPSRGVDGSTPLGAAVTGEDQAAIIAGLEKTYSDVVERNLDPLTRNRVTGRDRAAAFIAYLGGSLLKSGATPKDKSAT